MHKWCNRSSTLEHKWRDTNDKGLFLHHLCSKGDRLCRLCSNPSPSGKYALPPIRFLWAKVQVKGWRVDLLVEWESPVVLSHVTPTVGVTWPKVKGHHHHFNASTSIQQVVASLKDVMYIYVFIIKIITSKDLSITFSISGKCFYFFVHFFSPKKCSMVSGRKPYYWIEPVCRELRSRGWENWPLAFHNETEVIIQGHRY